MRSLFERLAVKRASSVPLRSGALASPTSASRLDRYIRKFALTCSSPPKEADLTLSIEQHQRTIQDLEAKQRRLEMKKMEMEELVRQRMSCEDRTGAAQALKRAKLLTNEINKLDSMRLKMETVIFGIESAITDQKTFGALNDLSSKHKSVMRQYPERFGRLLEELNEGCSTQQAVSKMFENESEEDQLRLELNEFETKEFERKICDLASVPVGTPVMSTITTNATAVRAAMNVFGA
eukprot:Gregarina_sp_Poly_1__5323@NODE_2814_length_1687_cov_77_877778_g1773_i0_p2_GENE_NODE_2814_length_1687_cov_77_877778_g1773_i0NODE_2814_length_1687_cov_77_877778_g1773_i0_p2_ORF_typecomplete_len237_score46_80Snf7/PF03357_21/8e15_NODE_2814_length_1687_cov_77_877778_g1773_i09211631